MAKVYDNATWVAAAIVADSAEFKTLGPRMYAGVASRAAQSVKTGNFMRSIRVERTDTMIGGKPLRSGLIRDWLVYLTDPEMIIIEFGATYIQKDRNGQPTGKVITQAPKNVLRGALGAL